MTQLELPGIGRPVERIDPLLTELARYWKKHPDLRLGQLLTMVATRTGLPLFYMEDHVVHAYFEVGNEGVDGA